MLKESELRNVAYKMIYFCACFALIFLKLQDTRMKTSLQYSRMRADVCFKLQSNLIVLQLRSMLE